MDDGTGRVVHFDTRRINAWNDEVAGHVNEVLAAQVTLPCCDVHDVVLTVDEHRRCRVRIGAAILRRDVEDSFWDVTNVQSRPCVHLRIAQPTGMLAGHDCIGGSAIHQPPILATSHVEQAPESYPVGVPSNNVDSVCTDAPLTQCAAVRCEHVPTVERLSRPADGVLDCCGHDLVSQEAGEVDARTQIPVAVAVAGRAADDAEELVRPSSVFVSTRRIVERKALDAALC